MAYDDDPYNEDDERRRARKYAIVAIIVFCLSVIALLAWIAQAKAQDQGYLPPQRYRNIPQQPQQPQAEEPNEYYAQDWIVYDAQHRVMCKDPYIRLDLKTVECVSTEKWR